MVGLYVGADRFQVKFGFITLHSMSKVKSGNESIYFDSVGVKYVRGD